MYYKTNQHSNRLLSIGILKFVTMSARYRHIDNGLVRSMIHCTCIY